MERFKVIAFTHKSTELDNLGRFFIEENLVKKRLEHIKQEAGVDEIFYLSTCNRVEFLFVTDQNISEAFLTTFFHAFNSQWTLEEIAWNIKHCVSYTGEEALKHIFQVASSLDSLVVGEREIIAQVRKSYEQALKDGLTGDFLRLIDKATVKTAKEVFTHTKIAEKSVSVVFLAYQMLRRLDVHLDAKFLIIGAGQTNATMAKYLKKHGFTNFTVFNRTLKNGEALAAELKGNAYSLDKLNSYSEGFDVILSCTGSSEQIVTKELYSKLVQYDRSRKIMIDLAIPYDIDRTITSQYPAELIEINTLKEIAENNLKEREKEMEMADVIVNNNIEEFKSMLKHRKVELAMQEVPRKIKEIRQFAVNSVFAKEIDLLDDNSKELLDKVLAYMEKKCISVPMVLAKDILIGSESK